MNSHRIYTVEYFCEVHDPRERGWSIASVIATTAMEAQGFIQDCSWARQARVVKTEELRSPIIVADLKDWTRDGEDENGNA